MLAKLHEGHPGMAWHVRMCGGLESLEIVNVQFMIVQSVSVININQL